MAEIVQFPKRFSKRSRPARPAADDPDLIYAKRQLRYARWTARKAEQRRFGMQITDFNVNAIATINIDSSQWRSPEYRAEIACEVLRTLLAKGIVGVGFGNTRSALFRIADRKHMSDRMITRCLNQHLTFTTRNDGMPRRSPPWLPEAMRFAAYAYHEDEDEETTGEADDSIA
jgi:hypothetical protein